MNNKLEELFDIEAAIAAISELYDSRATAMVDTVLKAATAGREYMIKSEVCHWFVNGERVGLPTNGEEVEYKFHVSDKWHRGIWIGSVDVSSHLCMAVWSLECKEVINGNFEVRPPKPKKIDHSSLVGSGIDCTYYEGGESDYYIPYDNEHMQYFKSIRLNHPMALTGKQVNAIPDGYNIQVFARREWLSLDEFICGIECCDYYRIRIDRIKDGYEL